MNSHYLWTLAHTYAETEDVMRDNFCGLYHALGDMQMYNHCGCQKSEIFLLKLHAYVNTISHI